MIDNQIAQQAVGHFHEPLVGTPLEQRGLDGKALQPTAELTHQARLAHAGLAHDGDQPAAAGLGGVAHGRLQHGHLGIAADHRHAHSLQPVAAGEEDARPRTDDAIGGHRHLPPFDGHRSQRLDAEEVAHQAVGVVGHVDAALGLSLIHI